MMRATGASAAGRPDPVIEDVIEDAGDDVGNLIDAIGNGVDTLPGEVQRQLDDLGVRVGRDGAVEIDRDRFLPDRRRPEDDQGPPPEDDEGQ